MNIYNILSEAALKVDNIQSIDEYIINFFNGLGPWGNLILIFLSLLLATLFGGFLGYQREVNGHAAGFRTLTLIAVGSALIMILSFYARPIIDIKNAAGETVGREFGHGDPMRLAAAGVTGAGFLGAGAIIKNGITVKGLTTSATIWVTMAIGMCCGAGYFTIALLTTVITLICLVTFRGIESIASKKNTNILIISDGEENVLKSLIQLLDKYEISFKDLDSSMTEFGGKQVLRTTLRLIGSKKEAINDFMDEFRQEVDPIDISIIK